MHELVRCKHERRCSRGHGADVSFRDVTIKIPDRGYYQGFEKSQLVEFLSRKKKVDFLGSSWPGEFERYVRRALVGLRADDVKTVNIEGLCVSLSPYVEKPFNSKVIKSFVPELRSRVFFFVFRDSYVLCIYVMNILCTFHIFMYGYGTEYLGECLKPVLFSRFDSISTQGLGERLQTFSKNILVRKCVTVVRTRLICCRSPMC